MNKAGRTTRFRLSIKPETVKIRKHFQTFKVWTVNHLYRDFPNFFLIIKNVIH